MKPDSYFTWQETPTPIIAPEWRAPAVAPRRKGVMAALSAFAARFRPEL